MKVFGICYVAFGLMAVIGAVLDADGVMAAIRRLPKRAMDGLCAKLYKFIMKHRPGLLMKIDYTPHVGTIPKDRLYQIDFRIDAADVEMMLMQAQRHSSFTEGRIPVSHTSTFVLEKYICARIRLELNKRVIDLVSIRASNLPSGDVAVNAQLVCQRPKSPQFAWAEKWEMLDIENRFE